MRPSDPNRRNNQRHWETHERVLRLQSQGRILSLHKAAGRAIQTGYGEADSCMTKTRRQNKKHEATSRVMDSPLNSLEEWARSEFVADAWKQRWFEEAVYYHLKKLGGKVDAKNTARAVVDRLRIPEEDLSPGGDDAETLKRDQDPHRKH